VKLPRDVSGEDLANLLKQFGYTITRQTGSHLRLTTMKAGQHHVSIPKHPHLRVGTLGAILSELADHLGMSREELIGRVFE